MARPTKTAFQVVEGWEQLPDGQVHNDVADVAVDSDDNVYLFTRMDPRVIVYDKHGQHLRSWGEDAFTSRPHGISVGHDQLV